MNAVAIPMPTKMMPMTVQERVFDVRSTLLILLFRASFVALMCFPKSFSDSLTRSIVSARARSMLVLFRSNAALMSPNPSSIRSRVSCTDFSTSRSRSCSWSISSPVPMSLSESLEGVATPRVLKGSIFCLWVGLLSLTVAHPLSHFCPRGTDDPASHVCFWTNLYDDAALIIVSYTKRFINTRGIATVPYYPDRNAGRFLTYYFHA